MKKYCQKHNKKPNMLLRLPAVLIGSLVYYLELPEHIQFSVTCRLIRDETTNRRSSARIAELDRNNYNKKYPLEFMLKSILSLRPIELYIKDLLITGELLELIWRFLISYTWIKVLDINCDDSYQNITMCPDIPEMYVPFDIYIIYIYPIFN